MPLITENTVMDFYLNLIKENHILFLREQKELKKDVITHIRKLQKDDDIHEKIRTAKELWKVLFEAAMIYIDPDKQGFDKLFEYFDQFVDFEELIFASEPYYRDHTLHCLWVYFLGEYIFHNPDFSHLFRDKGKVIKDNIEFRNALRTLDDPSLFGDFYIFLENIISIDKLDDSIRCVIALAHDLGYPLRKIQKINTEIAKILPFFSISEFSKFSFEYETIQQSFIEHLLELFATEISLTIDNSELNYQEQQLIATAYRRIFDISTMISNGIIPDEKILQELKEYLDSLGENERFLLRRIFLGKGRITKSLSQSFRYANDFEDYKHGIMSSYLLMKMLNSFSNIHLTYSNPDSIQLEGMDWASIHGKLRILKAMADHTSPGFQITDFEGRDFYSSSLILVDEIEDFSRISRANQYRTFINQFCKCELDMIDNCLCVSFIFDDENIEGLDPSRYFKDKCRKFLRVFDIPNLTDNIRLKIRVVGKLKTDKNLYELQIARNHVKITINDEEIKDMNKYLKSIEFYRSPIKVK